MNRSLLKIGKPLCQGYCLIVFLLFLAPKFIWLGLLRSFSPTLSQVMAALLGWFSWTFFEYILHRFWMHGKGRPAQDAPDRFNHRHHHTHPHDIRITSLQRILGVMVVMGLMSISIMTQGWFTMVAGFFTGMVIYMNMHWALHQSWATRWFPRLQEQHIHHHLKYPGHAFGVTTRLWDRLFGTTAPQGAAITAKVYKFYIDGTIRRENKVG